MTFKKTIQSFSIILAAGGLAACGGGAGGATEFAGVRQTAGQPFGISTTSPDSVVLAIPITSGRTASIGASSSPGEDQQVFRAYRNDSDYLIFDAESENGRVSVFAEIDNTAAGTYPGARASSFGGTLPASGSATYAGEYVGFLTRDDGTTIPKLTQSYITGDMAITADFESSAVSGAITDRARFLTSNSNSVGTMSDVVLSDLTIDGTGSGTGGRTSGGGLNDNRYVPANTGSLSGEWNIAFGGDNAAEAGGTILIDHNYTNNDVTPDDYVETGGFVVSKN